MKLHYSFIALFCIALILVTGCTSSSPTKTPATTAPITQAPITVATSAAPITTAAVTTTVPAATTAASDPIEHRYIRQYMDPKTAAMIGYEYQFYPGGTLSYKFGTTKMSSGNIVIDESYQEGSGTWTSLGNNKYLLKYLPTGTDGAQVIEEYTLVLAHVDPAYPGVTIAEHIESEFELKQINKGEQKRANYMYFPERAKID